MEKCRPIEAVIFEVKQTRPILSGVEHALNLYSLQKLKIKNWIGLRFSFRYATADLIAI